MVTGGGMGPDPALFAWLAEDIRELRERGVEVILVSSGAVASGMGRLGHTERPATIPEKQAVAAVGQIALMRAYEELFGKAGLMVGQVLLTRDDLDNRRRYMNAKNTLLALLDLGVVPVINENDTVVVEEIKLGDNDNLSSLVANLIEADCLIIFSDVEGLFERDPKVDSDAPIVSWVEKVDEVVNSFVGQTTSRAGTGGMGSKLLAAKRAVHGGLAAVIASGNRPHALRSLFAGEEIGTYFAPAADRLTRRKHWIAYSVQPTGALVVDDGAVRALVRKGTSLLPKGVVRVEGEFDRGEAVSIVSTSGKEVAKGLARYTAEEIRAIAGLASWEIVDRLGYKFFDEVVHRDDLVLLNA